MRILFNPWAPAPPASAASAVAAISMRNTGFMDLDINFFQAARIEMPPRPLAPPGAAPISTIEFWIGAGVGAGANSRKERNAARTALYHKVYGNKALEQGDRQLHAGEGAAPVAADGELVAPQSG